MNLPAQSYTTLFPRIERVISGLMLALLLAAPSGNAHAMDDPCFGITYQGKCEGNVVTWCESNELIQVDCSDHNAICQWQEEEGYWGCTPIEDIDACDHGEQGECIDDKTVAWCSGLDKTTLTCDEGTMCGWNTEKLYFDCIPEEDLEEGETDEMPPEDAPTNEPSQPNDTEEGLDTAEQVVRVMEGTTNTENSEPNSTQQLSETPYPFSASPPLEPKEEANGCQQRPSSGAWFIAFLLIGALRFRKPAVF